MYKYHHYLLAIGRCQQRLPQTQKRPVFVLARPTRPTCAGALPQVLGHWFCSQILLSSRIAFGSDCQMTGTGWQGLKLELKTMNCGFAIVSFAGKSMRIASDPCKSLAAANVVLTLLTLLSSNSNTIKYLNHTVHTIRQCNNTLYKWLFRASKYCHLVSVAELQSKTWHCQAFAEGWALDGVWCSILDWCTSLIMESGCWPVASKAHPITI